MGRRRMGRAGVAAVLGVVGLAVAGGIAAGVSARGTEQPRAGQVAAHVFQFDVVMRVADRNPDGSAITPEQATRAVTRLTGEAESGELLRRVVERPTFRAGAPKFCAANKDDRGELDVGKAAAALGAAMSTGQRVAAGEIVISVQLPDADEAREAARQIARGLVEITTARWHDELRDRLSVVAQGRDSAAKEIDRLRARRGALVRETKFGEGDEAAAALREVRSLELKLSLERSELAARHDELSPGENGSVTTPAWLIEQMRADPTLSSLRGERARWRSEAHTAGMREGPEAEAAAKAAAEEFDRAAAEMEADAIQRRVIEEREATGSRLKRVEEQIKDLRARGDELTVRLTELETVRATINGIDETCRAHEAAQAEASRRLAVWNENTVGWRPVNLIWD